MSASPERLLFEIAATSAASRSIWFVDACRSRVDGRTIDYHLLQRRLVVRRESPAVDVVNGEPRRFARAAPQRDDLAAVLAMEIAGDERLQLHRFAGGPESVPAIIERDDAATRAGDRADRSVFLFDVKASREVWRVSVAPDSERIVSLEVRDFDNDATRDIAVSTAGGNTFFLDFDGTVIGHRRAAGARDTRLTLVPRTRRQRAGTRSE